MRTQTSSLVVGVTLIVVLMMMIGASESLKPISIHKAKASSPKVLPSGILVNTQQRALNYMSNQLTPFIQKQIASTITIPDVTTRVDTPIGHLTATISQITLSNFAIPVPSIAVGPTALQITITGAQASLHCNWHYREDSWPHISDSGSADASVSIDITLTAQIVIIDEQHFNVVLGNFNAKFTNFNLQLHGGASWLYNVFINNFRDSIEQSAQNAINTQVAGAINTVLSKELATLNLQIPILSLGVLFDSTMQSVVYNTPNSFAVGSAGRLFVKNQPAYSGPVPSLPTSLGVDKMAEIFVSDYTLNTAGFAFNQAGLFNYLLTEHIFPSSMQWLFNTTNLQYLLPPLYAKYPGRELQIDFTTASPPTVSISPANGAEVNLIAQAIFQVVQPTGPVNAFALNFNAIMDLEASIVASNITGTLTYKSANVTLAYSNIGPLNVQLVSTVVDLIFEYGVVPIGNTLAKRGFPLPSLQGLTLVNPVITYQNRYIAIRSDFTYTPTTAAKKLKKY